MKRLILAIVLALSLGSIAPIAAEHHDYQATDLYQIDLATGELTLVGEVGERDLLIGFALHTDPDHAGVAAGLTHSGELIWFDVDSPDTVENRVQINGIDEDDMLVGIDYRPSTHDLYAISANSVLYWIDADTGEAMMVGDSATDPMIESSELGFDFNPTVDLIRVDVSTGQNLRLNPETGLVGETDEGAQMIDGTIAYAEGDEFEGLDARVVAAGYTNNVDGAESTSLYVLDAENNTLAIQDPPNDGFLNTVAVVDVMISESTAFDIDPDDNAYVTIPRESEEATPGSGNSENLLSRKS